MSAHVRIHPDDPQPRVIEQIVTAIEYGAVVAYPTDSGYCLGCRLDDAKGVERIRTIRQLDKHHNFTLVCADLSEIGQYAKVDNQTFRLLKRYLPGPYTFILNATSLVPKRLKHAKRRTVGVRVSAYPICQQILQSLGQPMMSVSLIVEGSDDYVSHTDFLYEQVGQQVDVFVDAGDIPSLPTTVMDLTAQEPEVLREGAGEFSG